MLLLIFHAIMLLFKVYYAAITVFWVCKEDLIVKSRCYKKHYNNMNLNNIITNFKTISNEVIQFLPEI